MYRAGDVPATIIFSMPNKLVIICFQSYAIDDKAISNNGDIMKVLVTVVDILKDFTSLYPGSQVFFVGSTDERTKLYSRILKVYHAEFSKEFAILGALMNQRRLHYVPYEPDSNEENLAFIIKRPVFRSHHGILRCPLVQYRKVSQ
jgi:hypothetical protein